jgi:hypothetical protein
MGVTHGHLNFLVAKQLRNSSQVHSGHHEATGNGVPQIMPGKTTFIRAVR